MNDKEIEQLERSVAVFIRNQADRFHVSQLYISKMVILAIFNFIEERDIDKKVEEVIEE